MPAIDRGLKGHALRTLVQPIGRGLRSGANRGLAFVVDTSSAKEFALAHWVVGGADDGRLFVRVVHGGWNIRGDIAGDVLASISTMQWNGLAKGGDAGAPMDDANFNRRQTIRIGPSVACAPGWGDRV